ncbi:MAG: SoxR reducing system RseC family protein [Clostridia bacterium]|nr:SoxR reducing system RseC family protein [Clostridia bacterium]
MLEIGYVESVNEKRGTARVVFDRRSACDKCKMCLTASGDKMKVYVEVKNTLQAKAGDRVGVAMNDKFVLKAAFIVYIIPVVLVGVGLAVFRKLSDLLMLAVIAGGLLLGVAIGIAVDRLVRKKGTFAPTMTEIYKDGPERSDAEAPSESSREQEAPAEERSENDEKSEKE